MGSSISLPSSVGDQEETEERELDVRGLGQILHECNRPRLRVRFGSNAGAMVNGFPSKGGVYELYCSPMELEFLGLDRFETALPSSDPAEEDALCAKMRLLGAEWWPSSDPACGEASHSIGLRSPLDDMVRFIGVTSQGGMWALTTNASDCYEKQLGRINNAMDMEEKCRQIERLGGTFYADPRECPLLDFKSPVPERAAIHVLVADDDASDRAVARSLLDRLGFSHVTTVGNGMEALDILLAAANDRSQRKPDIIFLDTDMPVMDGFECARIMRRKDPYTFICGNVPIIVMQDPTTQEDRKYRERCFDVGIVSFRTRPIQEKELERTLVRYVLNGRARIWLSESSVEDAGQDQGMMQEA
ncbi:CheY-like superfamily [Achaetomium macrosporum]|uniref:CheY-like superfamily n=1 Tax=Achaetomium macrosporum TaxID=79813 RepID=A0AAN7C0S0_9PEZI|nr:CheY-like superfamily [Achaetomium macrosporum]